MLVVSLVAVKANSDSLIDQPLADISKIDVAVNMFYLEHQMFPNSLNELDEYRNLSIKDPWGVYYRYEKQQSGRYKIYTLGKDGKIGGSGENRDRGSWEIQR